MANNIYNNKSIFNGDASFNSDINANDINASSANILGTVNLNKIGLSYTSVPTLSSNNIGFVNSTTATLFTGTFVNTGGLTGTKTIYQLNNINPGIYILTFSVLVQSVATYCTVFTSLVPGSILTQSLLSSKSNFNTQQTTTTTYFVTIPSAGSVIYCYIYITDLNSSVDVLDGGYLQLIRIA